MRTAIPKDSMLTIEKESNLSKRIGYFTKMLKINSIF